VTVMDVSVTTVKLTPLLWFARDGDKLPEPEVSFEG